MSAAKKGLIPSADKQRWMSHYWESNATNKGALPLTVDCLAARVAELTAEIDRRLAAGEPIHGLEQELAWRGRQIEQRKEL